jgi:16S rRNA processing protein RimM
VTAGSSSYDPETLVVGVLGRPHGVEGELMLRSHNVSGGGAAAGLDRLESVVLEGPGERRAHRVRSVRRVAGGWLLRLEGIDSREAAAAVTGAAVRVSRAVLPPLGPGEFFVADVLGCAVSREDGQPLGRVEQLFWNGAQDVMVVKGDRERLVPVVPAFVQSVDGPGRRVVVAWEDEDENGDGGRGRG